MKQDDSAGQSESAVSVPRVRHWKRYLVTTLVLVAAGALFLAHRANPVWKKETVTVQIDTPKAIACVQADGTTQETRILPPEGFARTTVSADSFAAFLRQQPLYPNDSKIYLYTGQPTNGVNAAAVYAFDTGTKNLQQCADSIIRLYSEYYLQSGQPEKIAFHTTSGFLLDYPSWRSGKRALVLGDCVCWVKLAGYDDSYAHFRSYLYEVMRYAGTKSLEAESTPIAATSLEIGDIICKGGAPGHAVLIVDKAVDEKGEACYLLAQGMMPAQSFHILTNDKLTAKGADINPWYTTADLQFPFHTPGGFTFDEGSLRRWGGGFATDGQGTIEP